MKPSFTRRLRRKSKPAKNEGAFFKKESSAEHGFFCEASNGAFFQPAVSNGQAVQRKCTCCDHSNSGEKEEQKVQRAAMNDKKEEDDKKLQRATDKKEEDDKKLMRAEDKKDEDKKLQRAPEKKEEDDKKLMRAEAPKKEEEDKKLQRAPEKKEEDKKLQKKESAATPAANHVGSYVSSLNGKGHSMPPLANQFFGERMGYDFSQVKVHTDNEAAESAKSVNAKAYAIGNNIVFNEGQYDPESQEGKRLLAHELTHIVQNGHEGQTIQREIPAPEPAPGPCTDEVDITSDFRNFITGAQQKINDDTTLTPERKAEITGGIQRVISAEGGVNIQSYKVFSCSKINSPLALPDENINAASDATGKILWLSNETWAKAATFLNSNSLNALTTFFQIIAHEKRHGTLGNIKVDESKLKPGFNQADADQAAYRVEEIIIMAEEIYLGKKMKDEHYVVPIKDQLLIRRHWAIIEESLVPEESARLRQLILSKLRSRYGHANGCDHSVTVGVFFSMEKGQWYSCNAGSVLGKVPEGLNLCKNEGGMHTVCPSH
jgi:hypothetical protein